MESFLDGFGEIQSYEHHTSWVEPRAQSDDFSCVYTVIYTIAPNISYLNEM